MNYLDNLLYKASDMDPVPLPDWARFYAELGGWVIRSQIENSRVVIALSVPTRSFCSALMATGAITQLALDFDPLNTSPFQHFQFLKELPNGTPVIIKNYKTNKYQTGTKTGYEEWKGEHYLKFLVKEGRNPDTRVLNPQLCKDIEVHPSANITVPKRANLKTIDDGHNFWAALLHDVDTKQFRGLDSTECLVIGQRQLLHEEFLSEQFIIRETATENSVDSAEGEGTTLKFTEGTLQDIARARSVGGPEGASKSDIWSSRKRDFPDNEAPPKLVLFDGVEALSKWRHRFQGSNWAVILDRTDRRYHDGIREINTDFLQRTPGLNLQLDYQCPYGIDVMAYYGDIS